MNNDWSNTLYITDTGFEIQGLAEENRYFYAVTNDMDESRRQILR